MVTHPARLLAVGPAMVQSPSSSPQGPIFQGTVVGQASPDCSSPGHEWCLPAAYGMLNKYYPYLPISPGLNGKQIGHGPANVKACFDMPSVVCTSSAQTAAIRRNLSSETSLSVASPVSNTYPTYTGTVLKAVPIAEEYQMHQEGIITDMSVVVPPAISSPKEAGEQEETLPKVLPLQKAQSLDQKSDNVSLKEEDKEKKAPLARQLSDIVLPPLEFMDCLDDILSPLDSDCEHMNNFSINGHDHLAREESCDLQAIFDSFAHENVENGDADDKYIWSMCAVAPAPESAVTAPMPVAARVANEPVNRSAKRRAVCQSGEKQTREPKTPEQKLPIRNPPCISKTQQLSGPSLRLSDSPPDTIKACNPFICSPSASTDSCSAVTCSYLFTKVLTMSDVGKLGRIILPRAAAEAHFPMCSDREGLPLNLYTVYGREYTCILKFWLNGRPNPKRMWLLDGCGDLINDWSLCYGAALDFYASDDGRYVSALHRRLCVCIFVRLC